MNIISVKESPEYTDKAIQYFQQHWANENSMMVYDDCIRNCVTSKNPLPQWYLMLEDDKIIGCAGLITNDFISRMDLYPWICGLFVEEEYRGHAYGSVLLDKARNDAFERGFKEVYLCTDHIGYYEQYDFEYIGTGYHPWGETSRIYCSKWTDVSAEADEAVKAIESMIERGEKAQEKFAPGTSQHTLQKNRSKALYIGVSLIKKELMREAEGAEYTEEDLRKAAAPIASLISKSEKAKDKLKPGTWQHTMLTNNLKALTLVSSLLSNALDNQQ